MSNGLVLGCAYSHLEVDHGILPSGRQTKPEQHMANTKLLNKALAAGLGLVMPAPLEIESE